MPHSRRDFLKASLSASLLASLGPPLPAFLADSALAAGARANERDTVLVVVQTLVPYGDNEYARSRPTLRLAPRQVHKIDSLLGFHPRMPAFARLYEEGYLSVLQGVGYQGSSRDHFEAMQSWHTARPAEPGCQTGWLGRTIDHVYRPDDASVPGVFVGQIDQPFALNAEKAVVPSLRSAEDIALRTMGSVGGGQMHRRALAGASAIRRRDTENPLLGFLQRATSDAYASGERINAVSQSVASARGAKYPPFELARALSTVAHLMRADIGIRIYFAELGGSGFGGFDNHANQRGNHGALLHELSESVAAFVDDLKRENLLDRVLLMTFSEFGRTVAENGRRGTGHGAAAPVFLAGGKLKGGLVGSHPSLTELDDGALKPHMDFRRVYATVLDRWLGFDSRPVLGGTFEPLDALLV
ncbi:MAG: DUF1501 domain-containing protein [Planctomycetota bacterium]|jgi:uncharacterized protein (DUF1501 family)